MESSFICYLPHFFFIVEAKQPFFPDFNLSTRVKFSNVYHLQVL